MVQKDINWRDWLLIVPARLEARRLPRKPLADLCGKPLVVRVFENLLPLTERGATVQVATDSEDIYKVCKSENVPVVMTSPHHVSGTDRCFEASRSSSHPFIMNVQGDQPFLDLKSLENLASALQSYKKDAIATLIHPSKDRDAWRNPNCVKVVKDRFDKALYFSRATVPYHREGTEEDSVFFHHIGIYAFTRTSLAQFCQWEPSHLEKIERLEQLRALENGMPIILAHALSETVGIDTEADLQKACEIWRRTH